MSDDWKVGDLALCVDDSPQGPKGVQLGQVYRVDYLFPDGKIAVVGEVCRIGYFPWRFRKIRPDEHEDCEPEFVTLLNNCKPVKVQA